MKRAFDLVVSLAGLVTLAPLFLIVATLIKVDDRGRIFYTQDRVGYMGCTFRILKFRTMVENADSTGPKITFGDDSRITQVGRWLRRYKLDELPQLINVLKGEMSFVGPRPEVPEYVAIYTSEQRAVLTLVPGITDPASIKYRNEGELLALATDPIDEYVNTIMPDKIRINLKYAAQATIRSDIGIILKTINTAVLSRLRVNYAKGSRVK